MRQLLSRIRQQLVNDGFVSLGPLTISRTKHLAGLLAKIKLLQEGRQRSVVGSLKSRDRPRSVVFVNNSYYNFYYLAAALRRRGWDALSVSLDDPNGPNAGFYHGNDGCLYHEDPIEMYRQIGELLLEIENRYRMVHFYGKGHLSLLPSEFDATDAFDRLPFDLIRLKQSGVKIGYSVCGCLDGVAQATVHSWSGGCCDRCVWQNRSDVCGDRANLAWGHKVHMLCDLIATEGFPALDYQKGDKVFREPLTTALDSTVWSPDIEVPERHRFARAPGEHIVYHSVGNFGLRSQHGRNIKGTGAVVAAIERLRAEDFNVRLEFATGLPSTEVRFLQVQADIIVDQLNYGRYGAAAREGMMLGRPTVCHINKDEPAGEAILESIDECPLVSADETRIYSVLRDLLESEEKRRRIGRASREFALKWHSADACAARFERVYDGLLVNERVSELKALVS